MQDGVKVAWYGRQVESAVGDLAGEKLRLIALLVQQKMVTSFTGRPSGGGGARHVPSAPGEPPAVDTGNLRSSVLWELDNGTSSLSPGTGAGATTARIGVPEHAIYGLYLEVGSEKTNLEARPWMVPAVDAVMLELGRVFG